MVHVTLILGGVRKRRGRLKAVLSTPLCSLTHWERSREAERFRRKQRQFSVVGQAHRTFGRGGHLPYLAWSREGGLVVVVRGQGNLKRMPAPGTDLGALNAGPTPGCCDQPHTAMQAHD